MKHNNLTAKIVFIYLIFSNLFCINQANSQIDSNQAKSINYQASKFKYLLEMATQFHYDTLNYEKISDAAFQTLLKSMDIQSVYYPKEEYEKLVEQNTGEGEGIGIEVVPLHDTLTVISVIHSSSADSAGILAGDKILFINGKSVLGLNKVEADKLIRGPINTTVQLIIKRNPNSSSLIELNLLRNEINIPSVTSSFVIPEKQIGYVQITRFSEKTDSELLSSLKDLKKKGMKGLVIDLRGNFGGVLESTLKSLEYFFTKNTKLLEVKARYKDFDTTFYSTKDGDFKDLKLVVLVDKNSASASEILSGVVQDYDRGIIIGERTYGKGSVQKVWKLNDGSGFRLTIAEYYTPSGRRIQKDLDTTNLKVLDPAMQLNMDKQTQENVLNALKSVGGKTQLPIYYSKNNRVIIGGGGVFPEIIMTNDTLNLLTRVLVQKGIMLEYIYQFLNSEKNNIIKNYKNDFINFSQNFKITDEFLENFKKYSISRNIWNENYFQEDKEYIRNYLKALISYTLWGENGFRFITIQQDKVAQKGIETFNNYDKYLQQK